MNNNFNYPMGYPHHNAYHINTGSPVFVQQQMTSSQLSFIAHSSQQQPRFNRSSVEDMNSSVQKPRPKEKQLKKIRESSEQKHPAKVETPNLQNKSQLIYSSSNFNFMHYQPKQAKLANTISTFKEMNIRIQELGAPIPEDPNEVNRTSTIAKSPSPTKRDSNKEWSEILMKTKSLEENLLQLKTSINNNLKKIQRYKHDGKPEPKSRAQRSENSLLLSKNSEHDLSRSALGSPMEAGFKNYLKGKQQEAIDEQNRLSKESTQSKYSTQSKANIKNQSMLSDERKLTNERIKAMPSYIQQPKQVTNGLSHNPSLTSLTGVQKPMVTERTHPRKDLQLNTDSAVVKVQTLSRINSPLQSKLVKENGSQHQPATKVRNLSNERQRTKDEMSLSIFSKSTSNFRSFQQSAQPFDPLYLPMSPLKDRIVTGQFIGRGKFSDVYLAKDAFTGFNFALKVIRKEIIREFQMEEQLAREIKIQSTLDHPNIVKLYGTFYDDEKIYLMLEFCSDGELFQHQYRQTERKFDESTAALMIEQILKAIQYMHERGVMHRDLKTENILLSYGQIKLCDLGCVCDIGIEPKLRTTFCGTVDYIAPEVITGGASEEDRTLKGYDQRCDNWQVGVLAYELVVGQTPFTDKGPRNEDRIMNNILQREVKFPLTITQDLKSFVTAALQKDPERRITITKMLQHPWIVNCRKGQNLDINSLLSK